MENIIIRLVPIFLAISLACWLFTEITIIITSYPADPFHYLRQLPILFWVGFSFIPAILIIILKKRNSEKWLTVFSIVFILVCILIIHGTHVFIYEMPRDLDTYKFIKVIEILNNGETNNINLNTGNPLYKTQFLGGPLAFSLFSQFSGIEPLTMAKYYPIFFMFILCLTIFFVALQISLKIYALLAPLFVISSFWIGQDHISPLSYAILLTVCWLFLFIFLLKHSRYFFETQIMLLIIWAAICMTHPTIAIFNLICLFIIVVFQLLNIKFCRSFIIKKIASSFLLYFVFFLIYLLFESKFIISRCIETLKAIFENIIMGDTVSLVQRNVVNPHPFYLQTYYIRMLTLIILGVITLFILFYLWRNRHSIQCERILVLVSFLLGYFCIGIFLVGSGYNSYGSDRAFILLLIPLSIVFCLSLTLLEGSKKNKLGKIIFNLLILTLILLIVLMPLNKHCGDPYDFVSSSEAAGIKFKQYYPSVRNDLYPTDELTVTNIAYNRLTLTAQLGDEYLNEFQYSNYNCNYDSGNYQIYI